MVGPSSNENDAEGIGAPSGADANGQAAILLVESLIHGLIARALINVADALDIIDDAVDARAEGARETGTSGEVEQSLTILSTIRASLSIDLPLDDVRPWPPIKGVPDKN